MSEKTLRICHLYPDLLNLYGDRGNILCMRRRLEWRGIGAEVTEVTVGEQADFTQFDLFFIGGGQDFEQEVLLSDLKAGKGSEIGGKFEELREIIDRVELKDKLGVCLDTCHIWDGGYDIVSDPDAVFAEFDRVIGLDRLKAVHLNNSLNGLGSHKDRHAKILEGVLPPEALVRIVCHKALAGRPFILETPNDDAGYAAEIAWLREQWEVRHA